MISSPEQIDIKVFSDQASALQAALLHQGNKPHPGAPEEILQKVRADVWAGRRPGRAWISDPTVVKLHPGAQAPNLKQHPLKRGAKEGIKPLISTFLKCQLIGPCQSHITLPSCQYKNLGPEMTGLYRF